MTAAELRRVVGELETRFRSYDGGDRPQSPPVRLMRELFEARGELSRAELAEEGGYDAEVYQGAAGGARPPGCRV